MAKLRVHNLGGTVSSDWQPRKPGGPEDDQVLLPRRGKIEEIIRYEIAHGVRNMFGENGADIKFSEADVLYDSSQFNVERIMMVVAKVREMLTREMDEGEHLLLATGTDTAAYLMHALAEGVTPKMLQKRCIYAICSQKPAPFRPPLSQKRHYPESERRVKDLNNVLSLMYHADALGSDRAGRIGLFTGGILLPPRGLHKGSTGEEQPFQCRYIHSAQAGLDERSPHTEAYKSVPNWAYMGDKARPFERARGRDWPYELSAGVESWSFDPTADYANLPYAVWGMVHAPDDIRRDLSRFVEDDAVMSAADRRLHAMVVQAPGSKNVSENERDLWCIHLAARIGLEANVPVVVIADPLQPQWADTRDAPCIYGGDFDRIRTKLDQMAKDDPAFSGEKSPVVSGGMLAKAEAKMEVARIIHRGLKVKKLSGMDFVQYVQAKLVDYEQFVTGHRGI